MTDEEFCRGKYILKDKQIIKASSFIEWGVFFEDIKNRIVAKDNVGPFEISTVFLGMDHSHERFIFDTKWNLMLNPNHTPILFETMIFKNNSKGSELYCDRYATWDEAEKAHIKLTQKVKETYEKEGLKATLKMIADYEENDDR